MATTLCDTERCDTCHADVIEGVDQNGQCARCAGTDSFDHLLKLMASGVTRDRRTGRFASLNRSARAAGIPVESLDTAALTCHN